MRFVLDASMALAWCFEDELSPEVEAVRDRLADDFAVVPAWLWDLEVWNALLVAARHGRVRSLEDNARALAALPIVRIGAPVQRVLELAVRHQLSSYDALYLALALDESLPLATVDSNLARAAHAERLEVLGVPSG